MALPPTRIMSWLQMCIEADPNYYQGLNRPLQYEFSNGRKFIAPNPLYVNQYYGAPTRQMAPTHFHEEVPDESE